MSVKDKSKREEILIRIKRPNGYLNFKIKARKVWILQLVNKILKEI